MSTAIGFIETSDTASVFGGDVGDQVALRLDPTRRCMLRFEVRLSQGDDEEALRYARRAMIREERTRGLEWDEPSAGLSWCPRRAGAGRRSPSSSSAPTAHARRSKP